MGRHRRDIRHVNHGGPFHPSAIGRGIEHIFFLDIYVYVCTNQDVSTGVFRILSPVFGTSVALSHPGDEELASLRQLAEFDLSAFIVDSCGMIKVR